MSFALIRFTSAGRTLAVDTTDRVGHFSTVLEGSPSGVSMQVAPRDDYYQCITVLDLWLEGRLKIEVDLDYAKRPD